MKLHYVYMIINNINGKVYIGQTINPAKRWNEHKNKSHNKYLKRSIEKYGTANFSFSVLTKCSDKDIDDAEKYWIKYYDSLNSKFGFNIEGGGTSLKIVSEETRKRMSLAQIGKIHSPETRKKISEVQKGKILSEETKQKMSLSRTGENNPMFGKIGTMSPSSKRIGALNPNFGKTSENNPYAKLTFELAEQIREEYFSQDMNIYHKKINSRGLAKKYNVSKTTILYIINNKTYTRK